MLSLRRQGRVVGSKTRLRADKRQGEEILSSPKCQEQLWDSPVSYQMGIRGSYPAGRATAAWTLPLTAFSAEDKNDRSCTSTT